MVETHPLARPEPDSVSIRNKEPVITQEPKSPVQSHLSPSLEALKSGIEAIECNLQQTEDNVEYMDFLHERKVQMGLAPDYRGKYDVYLDQLFKSMTETKEPWIQSWVDRKTKALEGDARYRSGIGSYEQPKYAQNDSIAFGKIASVMDFIFHEKSEPKTCQRPIRMKLPVKELLKPESILARSPEKPGIRWYHLPANNMSWVEQLMAALYRDDSSDDEPPKLTADHSRTILKLEYWYGRQNSDIAHRYHARFMRPTCLKLPAESSEDSARKHKADMVFFMPYLHYETDVARLHQHYIVKNVDTQAEEDDEFTDQEIRKLRCNVDEKLIRKYLRSPSPLHLRRTLDQSYYYTLPNTLIRDRDQVVLRYVKKELPTVEISPPVLMVDQCWLWVLGDTVITCFPDCWREENIPKPNDPLDVLERIVQSLRKKETYSNLSSPHDLAAFIIESCSGNILDTGLEKRKDLDNFHFLEWFYRSIKGVTADQTELFEQFCNESKKMQDILQLMMSAVRNQNRLGIPLPEEYTEWEETLDDLQKPMTGGLFDITTEISTLREVKDIVDELHMLQDVLNQQTKSIQMFYTVLDDRQNYLAIDMLRNIRGREDTLRQLQRHARQAYDGIVDLLDLKQKQANVSEARSGRFQAEQATKQAEEAAKQAAETTKQGTSIMLFTTVTILFLPLSSLASIFGLNAKELNGGNISIGIVFAYLFPISVFVVLFAFLLAFHTGVRMFFTLYIQIALAYTDRLTGFSRIFDESKVQQWEDKLKDMQRENQDIFDDTSSNHSGKSISPAEEDYVPEHTSTSAQDGQGRNQNTLWRRAVNILRSPFSPKAKEEFP